MKARLQKLIELAKRYATETREAGFPLTHNHLRNETDDLIRIVAYINTNNAWQVQFGNIAVVGWSKKIEIPWDVTLADLDKAYDQANIFYHKEFKKVASEASQAREDYNRKRIIELQKEIDRLS